jgi:hypothetical protein
LILELVLKLVFLPADDEHGNPVKNRSCTRSCKPENVFGTAMPLSGNGWEGHKNKASQKTCQFKPNEVESSGKKIGEKHLVRFHINSSVKI